MGYSVLTTNERTKIERQLKQNSKEQVKSQGSAVASSTSTSCTSTSSASTSSTTQSKTSTCQTPVNTKPKNEKSRLNLFLNSIDRNVPSESLTPKTISEEISLYGFLCKKYPTMDALSFWKTYGDQIPLLKAMAQRYLATPGTSVASESAFSKSSYVGRKERARLSLENLSYTVFLQDKLRSSSL